MTMRPVSIVVVSRDRPAALARCITGLAQLDHAPFEVVVVACHDGLAAIEAHPKAAEIKTVAYDLPNISAARNRGIAAAAGEVVAFIDDDAVPEPSWLSRLTAPFETDAVAATGGFVIGRNGFSLQWGAGTVDVTGNRHPLHLDDEAPEILHPAAGRAIKTEGTNMAVRRDVLARLGGFDPAYRFFLDETDLNMRIAATGAGTALVPLARVHHGIAPSARRHADRTPRDLTEIGASKAVFLRRHAPSELHQAALAAFHKEQRTRLLRAMQRGPLDPGDVVRLMRGLARGIKAGQARELSTLAPLPRAASGFLPFSAAPGASHRLIPCRVWARSAADNEAQRAVKAGDTVTRLCLSPTTLYHRMRFRPDGVWVQDGGLFGRSDRDGPVFRWRTFAGRVNEEAARLRRFRNL
ncbi:Putative glycosyltransferase EpsH [Roseivivax sp. THAF40]|uniref:glycosyltransferase family 2 protein n=1 Tax=unclassified Roseivivax TaxID=2639302 RepID=UPI001269402B|nr:MULTISPECIES: glycosyltransferase [unclassified Roseivivax]QFS84535.1 Putative glycosyltransferase EpsH [Roseivivax sp. THAF197b]QFT48362.1 Putative glycosyltransferase EpsH [Roseivivax sp. THAF40]